jgi:hypothetical protein
MSGIVAGGGMPEGKGIMRWIRWACRMVLPFGRTGRRP